MEAVKWKNCNNNNDDSRKLIILKIMYNYTKSVLEIVYFSKLILTKENWI